MNEEYPLTPFLDFATKLDLVDDAEAGDEPVPWGYQACGVDVGTHPSPEGSYEGMGDFDWRPVVDGFGDSS